MVSVKLLTLTAVFAVVGCTTPAQRKAAEKSAIEKEAAQEITRVCSLPKAEREAELKKIKEESGMVLYCGKE